MKIFAKRFDTSEPVRIEIDNGRISAVEPAAQSPEKTKNWPWVAPGLIDIQVNGYGGQEFSSASLTFEDVAAIASKMDAFCVTRTYPTVTTNSPEIMAHSVRTIAAARESSAAVARQFPGIHVEGPFLSPHDGPRGAHPLEFIRSPDWDEFQRLQEAADGLIRILTLSPEHDGSNDFIRRVADSGVIVSIGHSDATAGQIRAAADAGARMCTHLGNGCHPLIHRHDNNIWPQLADDRLAAGMIVDGHHLPPDVVKTFIRAKSIRKAILVSDMSGLAGLPPGRYPSELCELEILPSGKLVVAGQNEILAGASLPLGTCMANAMTFAGVTLPEAIAMAVYNPAKLLDTNIPKDSFAPGSEVELVLFDLIEKPEAENRLQFAPKATLVGAELVFGKIK